MNMVSLNLNSEVENSSVSLEQSVSATAPPPPLSMVKKCHGSLDSWSYYRIYTLHSRGGGKNSKIPSSHIYSFHVKII